MRPWIKYITLSKQENKVKAVSFASLCIKPLTPSNGDIMVVQGTDAWIRNLQAQREKMLLPDLHFETITHAQDWSVPART